MLLKLLAIFVAGVITDILVARYTRAVTEKRPLYAASLSSVLAIANLTLFSAVLAWAENSGIAPIAVFAGGNWLGTYLSVRKH